jgi:hypothetical protein
MLAMDRRITEATVSHSHASIQRGVLFCVYSSLGEPAARMRRGYLESVSDRHHRRRR